MAPLRVIKSISEWLGSRSGIATKQDLVEMENRIMATLQELKDAVAAEAAEVKARVDALQAEVQALKDQLAAGGTVTEAQLDEVLAGIKNIFTPA